MGSVAAVRRSVEGTLASPRSVTTKTGWDELAKRVLDVTAALVLLLVFAPLFVLCALAIKLESRGPVFYPCRRVGRYHAEFAMLKFRKMRDGAGGPRLTGGHDERFTRVGRILAKSKLDELPQLLNVVRGEMSIVGPRPEDELFVGVAPADFTPILSVRPGITGLSQLAFACESEILDRATDPHEIYVNRLLPQKIALDRLYAEERTLGMDLRILFWTAVAVVMRGQVAVYRESGRLGRRRRPGPGAMGSLEIG